MSREHEIVSLLRSIDAAVSGGGSELMKLLYSARFEENNDGTDTYTMVMPIVAGVEEESDNTVVITL